MRKMLFILNILFLFFLACTKAPSPEITNNEKLSAMKKYEEYKKDGLLMINICQKFANEQDIKKLHKAAVSTQEARVINCRDYNGECTQYLNFLKIAIEYSKDGILTLPEESDLKSRVQQLKNTIEEGKFKLAQQF